MLRQSPVNEQLVVSPLSVIFALAMVHAGAERKTKAQINQVILNGATDDEIIDFYSNLARETLKPSNGVQMRVANAFFIEYEFPSRAGESQALCVFRVTSGARVACGANQCDEIIDAFVSDSTEGKIQNFITEDEVRGAFSLIINAVLFSAEWEHEFSKESVLSRTFHSGENVQKQVEFLNQRENRYFAKDADMEVLSLRYEGPSYALNVILPKISIPKMKIETDFDLKKALVAMGVTEMFTSSADLTGIAKSPPLMVSDAKHRGMIEIDEKGTTAAAATGLGMVAVSAIQNQPRRFVADHPFIFTLTKDNNPLAFRNAETDFGLNMLRQSPTDVTLVVSPLSVIFALTLVQAGAKGETKSQINKVISNGGLESVKNKKCKCRLSRPSQEPQPEFEYDTEICKVKANLLACLLTKATDDQIVEFYSNLAKITLTPTNGVNTRIANAFFMDKKFSIEKQYADTIKREYSAKVEALDFEQAKQAAETIDEFVSKTTEGKIKHFITEDLVSEALSLIVNAIYFKSKWKHEFSKDSTTNKTFYSSANSKKEIEFLNERDAFRNYAEDEDMEVLSLPYNDKSYAFNIILPKKRFGLNELRGKLSGALIQKLLAKLQPTILTISFPKINIETDFKLKEALIAMGVTEMFSDSADLTGIAKFPPLTVSKAAHKAIIEVDESGTVAAAVTVFKVAMATSVGQPMIRRFVADHPFIFVLTKDNNPLFMGQFA
ncbi:serine proteinase inhibitor [Ancylostoma ceylanicum]|uniref:Serine proteinase inhibitor n=1 Tax=Ancylostoma ceylanicum TaxID=53326 RepID=A0A0D6LJL5_9BILA|nr:serine proteinase inhibitor [Ancylostoma ceylanicum]